MAYGKGAQVRPMVHYSSMQYFLQNLYGKRLFYSLAVARLVYRGSVVLVWLERASMMTRFSPGGPPVPRACIEDSLSLP
jgi:hypothetical protein